MSTHLIRKYDSPFSKRAREQGRQYQGGKSDDITVVVARVVLTTKENKDDL